ncbi:MAG: DUF5655 domain-containing protein [Bacilli bacterium]
MILKKDKNKTVVVLKSEFKLERELQCFFDENLETILNLKFVSSEFAVGNFKIDTLAYDQEQKAFKIIEYKNIRNYSLVDQGYTYLKLLLERKADFVLKYNEVMNSNIRIGDVDWTQSRIIFVSPDFTSYQINATDFKNIPVDLIKIVKYKDDIYEIDCIEKTSNLKIEEFNFNSENNNIQKEIVVYTEDDHISYSNDVIKELYYELRDKILELGNITMVVKKFYIAFKDRTNIVDIEFFKNELKINLNVKKGCLKDANELVEDVSEIGHRGNGDYRLRLKNKDDIEYVLYLIKQSLEVNKNL